MKIFAVAVVYGKFLYFELLILYSEVSIVKISSAIFSKARNFYATYAVFG